MFFIREICVNNMEAKLKVTDHISVLNFKDQKGHSFTPDNFWGDLTLNSGAYPPEKETRRNIEIYSADSYMNLNSKFNDGFIDLGLFSNTNFSVTKNEFEDKDVYGYIIFIPSSCDPIKSNGDIVFSRYAEPHQLVVVLKNDGEYIDLDGFHIMYKNGKLSAEFDI